MPEGDAEQEFLRQFLAERDAPCPKCQYNLRALTGSVCPECGEKIVVRVATVEPKQAAFIAGLIGLAGGAGFCGWLLVYFMLLPLFVPSISGMGGAVVWNLVALLILAAVLAIWIRSWPWVQQKSTMLRWMLVLCCWLLALMNLLIFTRFFTR